MPAAQMISVNDRSYAVACHKGGGTSNALAALRSCRV